jgi:hypothetical protein
VTCTRDFKCFGDEDHALTFADRLENTVRFITEQCSAEGKLSASRFLHRTR